MRFKKSFPQMVQNPSFPPKREALVNKKGREREKPEVSTRNWASPVIYLESRDPSQGTKAPRLMLIYLKVSSRITDSPESQKPPKCRQMPNPAISGKTCFHPPALPSRRRTLKPQSCKIIRLRVQFSYEVSEIKAIHHRLGTKFGKPGPAQPYLYRETDLEIPTSRRNWGEGEAETCRTLRTKMGLRQRLDPGSRLAGRFGPLPQPALGPVPPLTVTYGKTKTKPQDVVLDPERTQESGAQAFIETAPSLRLGNPSGSIFLLHR